MLNTARPPASPAPALQRGLAVLELLAAARRGLTLSEIGRRLGLAKSTVHGLLATLRGSGYVTCSEVGGRCFITSKLVDLGNVALRALRLREQTAPLLRALQTASQLAVHLAIWEQGEVVLLEKLGGPGAPRIATWIGKRMDAHCTGCGKAILAHLPEPDLERHIREHGLPKHNEYTISSPKKLKKILEAVRQAGYAVDDEEDELGFRCVGAPIFDESGVVAAVSLVGTTDQVIKENLRLLGELVKSTAGSITGLLGGGHSTSPQSFPNLFNHFPTSVPSPGP
jgi:DNA-binding IclR family transcriptional regulator